MKRGSGKKNFPKTGDGGILRGSGNIFRKRAIPFCDLVERETTVVGRVSQKGKTIGEWEKCEKENSCQRSGGGGGGQQL